MNMGLLCIRLLMILCNVRLSGCCWWVVLCCKLVWCLDVM